jgi:hypothetical protein
MVLREVGRAATPYAVAIVRFVVLPSPNSPVPTQPSTQDARNRRRPDGGGVRAYGDREAGTRSGRRSEGRRRLWRADEPRRGGDDDARV